MTAGGMTFAFITAELAARFLPISAIQRLQLSLTLSAIVVGFLQSFVLKDVGCDHYFNWIWIKLFGWTSVGILILTADFLNTLIESNMISFFQYIFIIVILTSLSLGYITGIGLKKQLRA